MTARRSPVPTDPRNAARRVRELALESGFDLVGIARAETLLPERDRYLDWLEAGKQGEMRWMNKEYTRASTDPATALPGVRSVVAVAMSYWSGPRPASGRDRGLVARYAWGHDYHAEFGARLESVTSAMSAELGATSRWFVDIGPAMDKAWAARSGIGWQGKNTNILTEGCGSFVLLGEILTDLDLEPDLPLQRDCGSCRLCVVACPTGALDGSYSIDARRCISYLTIEHRGPIALELRPLMGAWVFGCDICQDVCPPTMERFLSSSVDRRAWTGVMRRTLAADPTAAAEPIGSSHSAHARRPLVAAGTRPDLDLIWLLTLTHEQYLEAFRGTAIRRAKPWMLRRNACIALGNIGGAGAASHLLAAVLGDEHPVVRGHAAWAVGRLAERNVAYEANALAAALEAETDGGVRSEIARAVDVISGRIEMP